MSILRSHRLVAVSGWLLAVATACLIQASCSNLKTEIAVSKAPGYTSQSKITSIRPLVAMPGEKVNLVGSGFNLLRNPSLRITLQDQKPPVIPVKVVNDSLAEFIAPEGLGLGLKSATLLSNGSFEIGTFDLVADQKSNSLPIIIDEQSEICSTKLYIDRNGEEKTGTKSCETSSSTASCVTPGASNCLVDGINFVAAEKSKLSAGNIKAGESIGGVVGQFPSATYRLPLSNGTDLTSSTFNPQVKSAATFQYFDSAGVRYTGAGDSNLSAANIVSGVSIFGTTGTYSVTAPDPWDIRFGTTVNGITGKLKTACRNAVNSAKYNFDGALSGLGDAAMTSGSIADVWDTVDDWNNSGAVPSALPSGWDNYLCGGVETSAGDDKVWKDVTTAGCSSSTSQCRFKDKISRLEFSALPISEIFGASTSDGSTTVTVDSTLHLFTGMVISEMSGNIPSGATITSITSGTTFELSVPATATDSDLILKVNAMTWSAAVKYCDALTWDGQSDWRLPTQKEFLDAFNHGFRSAVLSAPNWMTSIAMSVWTATNYSWDGGSAWIVHPGYGSMSASGKGNKLPVICVR